MIIRYLDTYGLGLFLRDLRGLHYVWGLTLLRMYQGFRIQGALGLFSVPTVFFSTGSM